MGQVDRLKRDSRRRQFDKRPEELEAPGNPFDDIDLGGSRAPEGKAGQDSFRSFQEEEILGLQSRPGGEPALELSGRVAITKGTRASLAVEERFDGSQVSRSTFAC